MRNDSRIPAINSSYLKGETSFLAYILVQSESSVLRMKFSTKNTAFRVAEIFYQ